jgi:hypothetical protein
MQNLSKNISMTTYSQSIVNLFFKKENAKMSLTVKKLNVKIAFASMCFKQVISIPFQMRSSGNAARIKFCGQTCTTGATGTFVW